MKKASYIIISIFILHSCAAAPKIAVDPSSITDVAPGDYKPQLTSAMSNATFFVSMTKTLSEVVFIFTLTSIDPLLITF